MVGFIILQSSRLSRGGESCKLGCIWMTEAFSTLLLAICFPETTPKKSSLFGPLKYSEVRSLCKVVMPHSQVHQVPETHSDSHRHSLFLLHFINASVLQTHFVNLTTFPPKPCSNKTVCVQSNMPGTYSVSNNNTSKYYSENRVREQCSLTTSRHSDFTQEMSIEREIEGQIDSL